ncbi:MAG: CoA transferase [Burkholderiales bacterium]|jgi:crotonobetainyl-CoA:carnitine CoA-transferase CaiB-like acyl-CoA transferase|nr:CoA transferase [Burkholderiales bacterium]
MVASLNRPAMLAGLKVVDLTRNLPGPFATLMLADMGAEVMKVEPPQGDEARLMPQLFEAVNRNKKGCRRDIKKPADLSELKRLIEGADVLVEGFRPGVLEPFGLSYADLSAVNPKLVMCSITGYGQTGSWANRAGHDINFMAMSGLLDQLRTPEGELAMPNVQFGDLLGGSAMAVVGLLAAVIDARATGLGRHVDISMTHSLLPHAVGPFGFAQMWEQFGQVDVPSNEDLLGGGLPCYGIYKTSDGRYLAVGALEYKFWEAASRAFGHAQWADIHWQRGVMPQLPASKSLKKMVADLVASKPLAHWAEVFSEVDACVTPVLTLKEAMAHPLFENRAVLREQVEKSSKEVVSLGHPIEFSDYKVEVRQKAP